MSERSWPAEGRLKAGCSQDWLPHKAALIVGSEEARLHAGLRPPLKLYMPISSIQLSRRRPRARAIAQRRD